jgi:hypothetical protein
VVGAVASGSRSMAASRNTGGLKAAAGNGSRAGGGAVSCTGEHLRMSAMISIEGVRGSGGARWNRGGLQMVMVDIGRPATR